MDNTFPLEECSIKDIYIKSDKPSVYKIPIYQRNYAWGEDEITALVKDVYDSMLNHSGSPYYIGTLVTYKRGDNEYEVIDGQQRLTTIYLILKALGIKDMQSKLTYTSRRLSADTIKRLPDVGEESDMGIINGFENANKAIDSVVEKKNRQAFTDFFLDKVHIIHYRVPKDVDLNHYFEVMNSRGEQLEKHEIVKSELGEFLKDRNDLSTFSRIWEACSNMNVYIQQAFSDEKVFGVHLNDFCIESFDEIPRKETLDSKKSIIDILGGNIVSRNVNADDVKSDKFQPIIDFPNFLLIVLKLTFFNDYEDFTASSFTLDDKELVNEFDKALDEIDDKHKDQFVKTFAFNLLQARYFLDNYVVHHIMSEKDEDGDNPWQLQYYYRKDTKKGYPKNLVDDDDDTQKELVHLLSMFEVSFTPRQRKNYLFYCLAHLFDDRNTDNYLEFLQKLADKYFYDIYLNDNSLNERNLPRPNAFDGQILYKDSLNLEINDRYKDYRTAFYEIYDNGTSNISLFVFNYTDYKLWKKYADTLRGLKERKDSPLRRSFFDDLGCSDFELDAFNNFYFSRTRKSLEHYYPQSKAVEDGCESERALSREQINCFGNFAMIGAEANSSGSNWDPKTKLDHYTDRKADAISVASLKFKIMMQMCRDNLKAISDGILSRREDMAWNFEDIKNHQQKMTDIVIKNNV